jgi:sugar diacid utilization regulator
MKCTKKVTLNLVGLDGNAFALLAAFKRQATREGWTTEEITAVLKEAKSGDYDHLLRTLDEYCESDDE